MLITVQDLKPSDAQMVGERSAALVSHHQMDIWRRTDRLFVGLMIFQWLAGIAVALILSPRTWSGSTSAVHPHVWQAVYLGFGIAVPSVCFGLLRPGATLTRHVIAVCQMLSSALLIHLGNGRVEMHFHVFGSLAFLAFYRDWRVLISASVVVAVDHLLRGLFFPESVFGLSAAASEWRWLEHTGWVIFEDMFLLASCRQGVSEMHTIAERQALLEYSHQTVEDKVEERTQQLKELQAELVTTARSAGMAEIATSVLHNVGNVLNSVNISVGIAMNKVQDSPVKNLALVVDAFDRHKSDLGGYLTEDPQGRQIPEYLSTVSEVMREEQSALLGEMASLAKHVDHIKQIVSVQQQYAKQSAHMEDVNLADLLEDAINVSGVATPGNRIVIAREFQRLPKIAVDKHAVLQILINLLGNAKQAMLSCGHPARHLTLRVIPVDAEGRAFARVQIIDDGIGIDPANLARIFTHGFTTKKDGHGFGLHASANSAKQMRGSLTATSAGLDTGAAFTLDIPLAQELAAI